ncbi:endoglucanase 7 isoform X2 [Eurytemora carolleeae]|uniref:endoglucanase 7 isoform X2 n=1 Tax=Eurytemora carolleeae TaxID=1294199 RepID=UPI000C757AF2|nr:endoglucanase 7 isoform X2 [Eurytemora carolleeae]|eukprot:XP_023342709.1 endoglucanase 7-like isoform X2 [Eurytemora affinis]
MFLLPCILVSGLFVFLPIQGSSTEDKTMICEETKYNYTEVIRISLLFYEAQRSGDLTPANRIPWRADSSLLDKGDDGEDLVGGYHDAGDYVKFGFPLASALTVLSWGGLTFMSGYQEAGQLGYLEDAVKWGTDYIIKAHVEDNVFYCQVGSGEIDHDYPGYI